MPPNRHVEFKKGGWGAAITVMIATVAVFLSAFAIHKSTFREPTDVMMRQMGGDTGHGAEGHAPGTPAGAATGATTGATTGGTPGGTPGAAPAASHGAPAAQH
jgi:hypothetical protein